MKQAIVHPGTTVQVIDTPIPVPHADQVVIKVACSGCNPKDFKVPEWTKMAMNQGDDIAGLVHSVGQNVVEFKPGDRVAAFHEFLTPNGSWSEYSVAWAYTTFHLPHCVAFEDAATIPLAAMTAAVGLYLTLGLPEPWRPMHRDEPLIIYGASSAVGSFALQLAKLSNIHPIIAIAGKATEHVEKLIDRSKGDAICDYREGADTLISKIQEALFNTSHSGVKYALDCISDQTKATYQNILRVLDPQGQICLIQNYDIKEMPPSITHTRATVRWVHQNINTYAGLSSGPEEVPSLTDTVTGCRDFAYVMYRFFSRALAKGFMKGHPYQVVTGGLAGVQTALTNLKLGKASGTKYVIQIADTRGL